MDTTPYVNILVTRRYRASAARLFDAWIDPAIASRWLFATASRPVAHVAIDARVKGSFRFVERQGGEDVEYTGRYIEIIPPRRLGFILSIPYLSHASTRVTVEIAPLSARGERYSGSGGRGKDARRFAGRGSRAATSWNTAGAGRPRTFLTLTHENVPAHHASRVEARWTGILYGLGETLGSVDSGVHRTTTGYYFDQRKEIRRCDS